MITIQVSPKSIAALTRTATAITNARADLKDRSEPLKKAHDYMQKRWVENIQLQGQHYGGFAPLRPNTVARRGSSSPILIHRGKMLRWVADAGGSGKISPQAVNWEFAFSGKGDGSQAVLHTTGYFNVPYQTFVTSRVVFDTNAEDEEKVAKLMESHINTVVRKYF